MIDNDLILCLDCGYVDVDNHPCFDNLFEREIPAVIPELFRIVDSIAIIDPTVQRRIEYPLDNPPSFF